MPISAAHPVEGLHLVPVSGPDRLRSKVEFDILPGVSALGIPADQVSEYGRRLSDQRWLLIIESSAIDLPLVQRALRSGDAIDIDILPEAAQA